MEGPFGVWLVVRQLLSRGPDVSCGKGADGDESMALSLHVRRPVVRCRRGSLFARTARADGTVPPAQELLPALVDGGRACASFRSCKASICSLPRPRWKSAEGDVKIAGAVPPNPVGSVGYGHTINYNPAGCEQCSENYWSFGLSDSAAIEDALSGKRGLRLKVARNALAAARLSRADAQRNLEFQVKAAYLQVAQAVLAYRFAKEIADLRTKKRSSSFKRATGAAPSTKEISRGSRRKSSNPTNCSTTTYRRSGSLAWRSPFSSAFAASFRNF